MLPVLRRMLPTTSWLAALAAVDRSRAHTHTRDDPGLASLPKTVHVHGP